MARAVVEPQSCHSGAPGQAGEMGQEEPCDVQQGEMPGPAPGEEQPHGPVHGGGELRRERPGVVVDTRMNMSILPAQH